MTNRATPYRGMKIALIGLGFLLVSVSLNGSATAQTLFRCGKTYQDRPCSDGQESKVIGVASSAREPEPGRADASCEQRGAAALKIVWRREGGTTLEQALSDVRSGPQRELIEEVYRARGTAAQVRTRIETDCMAEKERKERYAAMMEAARPASPALSGRPLMNSEQPQPATEKASASRAVADNEAARKKETCDFLVRKLDGIRASQREGGSIARMDQLKRDLNNTERDWQKNGCT